MIWRAIVAMLVVFAGSQTQAQNLANKEQQTQTISSQMTDSREEQQQGTVTSAPTHPSAQTEDPEKDQAIRNLLKVMGASNLSDQMINALMPQIRSVVASAVPEDGRESFMDSFSQKLRARLRTDDIIDAVVSIYANHFSLEDIQELTRFYGSPLGQRLTRALPQITNESQAAGVQIGRKAFLQALRDMSDDYPDLKKVLPPDEAISNGGGTAAPTANPK
jgi:hypothetical protein